MHGFKDSSPFAWMVGREVVHVGLGAHEFSLSFEPNGSISVQGDWMLLSPAGDVVDRCVEHSVRTETRLHHLLTSVVLRTVVESPTAALISFANGFGLRLVDDDPRYEAVVMEPGSGPTVVI